MAARPPAGGFRDRITSRSARPWLLGRQYIGDIRSQYLLTRSRRVSRAGTYVIALPIRVGTRRPFSYRAVTATIVREFRSSWRSGQEVVGSRITMTVDAIKGTPQTILPIPAIRTVECRCGVYRSPTKRFGSTTSRLATNRRL